MTGLQEDWQGKTMPSMSTQSPGDDVPTCAHEKAGTTLWSKVLRNLANVFKTERKCGSRLLIGCPRCAAVVRSQPASVAHGGDIYACANGPAGCPSQVVSAAPAVVRSDTCSAASESSSKALFATLQSMPTAAPHGVQQCMQQPCRDVVGSSCIMAKMGLMSIGNPTEINSFGELQELCSIPMDRTPQAAAAAAAVIAAASGRACTSGNQPCRATALGFTDLVLLCKERAAVGLTAAVPDAALEYSLQDTAGAAACLFSYDSLPRGVSLWHAADQHATAMCPISLDDLGPSAASAAIAPVTLLTVEAPTAWPVPAPCGRGAALSWAAQPDPWAFARETAAAAAAVTAAEPVPHRVTLPRCMTQSSLQGGAAATGASGADPGKAAIIGDPCASATADVCVVDVFSDPHFGAVLWGPPCAANPTHPREVEPVEHGWQDLPSGAPAPVRLPPAPCDRDAALHGSCVWLDGRGNTCYCCSAAAAMVAPHDPSVLLDDEGGEGSGQGRHASLLCWDIHDTRTLRGLLGTLETMRQRPSGQVEQERVLKPPGGGPGAGSGSSVGPTRQESGPRCIDVKTAAAVAEAGGSATAAGGSAVADVSTPGIRRVRSTMLGYGSCTSSAGSAMATEEACSGTNCTLWERSTLPAATSGAPTVASQTQARGKLETRWELPSDAVYGEALGAGAKGLSSPAARLGHIQM